MRITRNVAAVDHNCPVIMLLQNYDSLWVVVDIEIWHRFMIM